MACSNYVPVPVPVPVFSQLVPSLLPALLATLSHQCGTAISQYQLEM